MTQTLPQQSTHPVQPTVGAHQQYAAQRPAFPRIGPSGEVLYEVRVTQHVGLAVAWWQQVRIVRGTRQQCQDVLRQAQILNLTVGWWSFLSVLLMNWIAILCNVSASRTLKRQAAEMARLVHPSARPVLPQPGADYWYR